MEGLGDEFNLHASWCLDNPGTIHVGEIVASGLVGVVTLDVPIVLRVVQLTSTVGACTLNCKDSEIPVNDIYDKNINIVVCLPFCLVLTPLVTM